MLKGVKIKTLTVKVPEELDLKLAAVAAKRGESKSNLIRTAFN
jgi:predicted transcriptional regulator